MSSTRVDQLVTAWRDARDRGTPLALADACREHPELVPAVAERIATLSDERTRTSETALFAAAETSMTGEAPTQQVHHLPAALGGYRVDGILGQGGMGAVYLAHDDRLGRVVALKAMRPEVAAQPAAKDRFLREARAVAQIDHDNIISIWQVGEDAGIPFIAMPLLQGESLATRLQRERVSPLGVILKVGRELAEGLAAAHAQGLIHRDIKPANVWLEGDLKATEPAARFRRCKLLDFGLVRPVVDDAHLTASGMVVGTPAYMSPEQAAGNPVDFRTDLFSLGALMYRMATGGQPFAGSSVMAVLTGLAVHQPPSPTTKNLSLPVPLANLIMKLLTKEPAGRPQSAREVAASLRDITRQLNAARKAGSAVPASLPSATVPVAPVAAPASSPWADLETEATARPLKTAKAPSGWNRKWAAVGIAAAAVVFAAGVIVIKVKGPGGKETIVEVPEGSHVDVDEKGNVLVELPEDAKPQPTPAAADLPPKDEESPTASADRDRRVAEWALSIGGKVVVTVGGGQLPPVAAVSDLPAGPFKLIRVYLNGCGDKVTDAGLENLKDLPNLTHLTLSDTPVTDAGLEQLQRLNTLVDLRLNATHVTDAGMEHLKGLTGLVSLAFVGTPVTDAGLDHLSGMTGLYDLDLHATQITDAGLDKLKGLSELLILDIGETGVTNAGLKKLKVFTKLEKLVVSGPQLTNAGLIHIKGLTGLKFLMIGAPQVTDAGLEHLSGLTGLAELTLQSKATPAGVEKLRKALPSCTIIVL